MQPGRPAFRHAWRTTALVMVSLLAALAVAEGVLRAAGVSYPFFWQADPELGAVLRPGAEGVWRREGEAFVRINSAGLRDREHALSKPAGVYRVAVLGDSFAEAVQVPVDRTFWSVLERSLGGCPALGDRSVEVINFGVSGYGTAQELLTLRQRVWRYAPDLVLLAFTTGNDVRNNSRDLEPEKKMPFFVLDDGRLVLDQAFAATSWFRIKQSPPLIAAFDVWNDSRVLQVLRETYRRAVALREQTVASVPGKPGAAERPFDGRLEAGLDASVYVEPSDPRWAQAWRLTEALLATVATEVRAHGARLLVVTLSSGPQVHPDPRVRQDFERELGVADLFRPEREVQRMGAQHAFAVLSLAPAMQREAERRHVFLHGFANTAPGTGHWNVEGHRLAGELIAEHLCRSTLLAPAAAGGTAQGMAGEVPLQEPR